MALWTPAEITSATVALWHDASDDATITLNGSAVSQWDDKSGNGRHAVQATAANQPLRGTDSVYNTGSDLYLNATISGVSDGTQNAYTIFVVATPLENAPAVPAESNSGTGFYTNDANNNNALIITGNNSLTTSPVCPVLSISGNRIALSETRNSLAPYNVCKASAVGSGNRVCAAIMRTAAGAFTSSINFSAVATSPTAAVLNLSWLGAVFPGHYSSTSSRFNGHIHEQIILFGVPSIDDYQKLQGYLAWRWGLEASLPSDHPYKNSPPGTQKRAYLTQPYYLEGSLRALLVQPCPLLTSLRNFVDQLYGLKMLVTLEQFYGDMPQYRALCDQNYSATTDRRRLCVQPYGDMRRLRRTLAQEWSMPAALLAVMEQRYHIAGEQMRGYAEQVYLLAERDLLRQLCEQHYALAPGEPLEIMPYISVLIGGVESLGGIIRINGEFDESEFSARCELVVADPDTFARCRNGVAVVIAVDADEYTLRIESPRRSRPGIGEDEYIVPLVSPTVVLDAPYAEPISRSFIGAMASALVTDLAAEYGVAVEWRMVDEYKPTGLIVANAETPLAVIRRVVAGLGGILQSTPSGSLLCRPEYPDPVNTWETATPPLSLTDQDSFFSTAATPETRDGYNRYQVSNETSTQGGLTLEQVDIDAETKEIRVYQVPWDDTVTILLDTSGGGWVTIEADGIISSVLTEQVEIVGGEGRTQHPLYGLNAQVYKQDDLGGITPAEDGGISTELAENSLVDITYTTRYWRFIARSPNIEDVQFWPVPVGGAS